MNCWGCVHNIATGYDDRGHSLCDDCTTRYGATIVAGVES